MEINYDQLPDHYVYSQEVIEFVTVVAETCLFLERAGQSTKTEFVDKATKILPLLYLKAILLEQPQHLLDGFTEQFVSEEDYNYVNSQIQNVLGADDTYLDTFHAEMQYSEIPVAATISENLTDIYQEIKNLAGNYQTGETEVMNDALADCMEAFWEHWGQKTLSALQALHALKRNRNTEEEDYCG